jgi:hypothetical protein
MDLRECYDGIKRLNPDLDLDSYEVVEEVSRIRELWRPKEIRVVLLAESHVHTSPEDSANRWHLPGTNYKGSFVRFVYCIANGEKSLAPEVGRNTGTSQFWKIFYSCLNRVNENRGFAPIVHSTPGNERIANKIDLLIRMREAGIWLIDASIVSVNHVKDEAMRKGVLRYSWNHYTGPLIKSLSPVPKHILIIGRMLRSTLREEIVSLKIACTPLPQPQARLPSPGYFQFYKTYFEKCSAT